MLIPVNQLIKYWEIYPKTILHVGAHEAEERDDYLKFWDPKIYWIEAQPDKVEKVRKTTLGAPDVVIQAAVWDISDLKLQLKITNNTQSTSLLDLGTHQKEHPEIEFSHSIEVKTARLDSIIPANFIPEFLALDIQGVELRALKGFGPRIKNVKWIYTEVNREYLYDSCCLVGDIDEYLKDFDFVRVATRWTRNNWGDALYIRSDISSQISRLKKFQWKIAQTYYLLKLSAQQIKFLLRKHSFRNQR